MYGLSKSFLRITVVAWQVDFLTFEYYVIKSSLEPLIKTKVISTVTYFFFIENSLSLLRLNNFRRRYPDNGIRNVFSKPLSRKFVTVKDFLVYKCPRISQRLPKWMLILFNIITLRLISLLQNFHLVWSTEIMCWFSILHLLMLTCSTLALVHVHKWYFFYSKLLLILEFEGDINHHLSLIACDVYVIIFQFLHWQGACVHLVTLHDKMNGYLCLFCVKLKSHTLML